jgi:hypothetical protein
MKYMAVNWLDEGLDDFYGDDNKGFIYGVYAYEDGDDCPTDVHWFKSEEKRDLAIEAAKQWEKMNND